MTENKRLQLYTITVCCQKPSFKMQIYALLNVVIKV